MKCSCKNEVAGKSRGTYKSLQKIYRRRKKLETAIKAAVRSASVQ